MSSFLYRLGRACYRFRGRVLLAWAVIIVLVGGLAVGVGGHFNDVFEVPGASSTKALAQLKVTFPEAADASATVLINAPAGRKLEDRDVKKAVAAWTKVVEEVPFVRGVIEPYNEHVDGLISADGASGRAMIRVQGTASTITDAQREELTAAAKTLEQSLPGAQVLIGGEIFAVSVPHITVVEALGLAVAILVLVLTLGSLVASMMPVGTAVAGVGIGVLSVMIAAGVISVSSTTLMLAIMLGLAVGIDYALFILSRHRDQLATGLDVEESAARAVGTAGSAVVFAGLTVIIALVGLSIAGLPFLTVMGVFGALTVGFEVLLALTLLPAFMGFAGERLRPKVRKTKSLVEPVETTAASSLVEPVETTGVSTNSTSSGGSTSGGGHSFARRWVRGVTRWPVVTIVIVLVAMGGLAYPARDLQMALPTSGHSLPGTQDRATFDEITSKFGVGFNGPLIMTVGIVELDDPVKVLDGLKADVEAMPGVQMVAAATPNANVDTGMVQIIPTTGPDEPATADLVERLRERQGEWQQRYAVDTEVTGFTAIQIDVTSQLQNALLPFGIFVVGLSLVLLTMVFRSIWVPIKAALGYLLSVAAAFGTTTLVFNKGWGKQIVNLPETGPVISFLPIILMGILFGLAMDYEVFLVSRMREEYVHGNTERSVEDGFVHSSKVVVAAGLIMFAVFAFFVPNGEGAIKPIAFSLAVGVVLDAFVVRMTLVPAVMKLLGRHAWWLPKWLDTRLPSFDIEGEGLTRQVHLASWPSPDDTSAIAAEGIGATVGGRTLFSGLDLHVQPGQVLVVEGEHAQRRALLLALAGRVKLTEGTLKVLGRVLPEEAPVVRGLAPVLNPSVVHFGRVLSRQRGGLVFVDRADELSSVQDRSLRRALSEAAGSDSPITWVLGVMPGSDLEDQLPQPYQVVRLPSHLALEGALR